MLASTFSIHHAYANYSRCSGMTLRRGLTLMETLITISMASTVLAACITGLVAVQRHAKGQNESTLAWLALNNSAEQLRMMKIEKLEELISLAEMAVKTLPEPNRYRLSADSVLGISPTIADQLASPDLYLRLERQDDGSIHHCRFDLSIEWLESPHQPRRRMPLSVWRSWKS